MTPLARILALPVQAYRLVLSPWLGHSCRFQPTCSAYALEALERHGGLRGGALTVRRLLRCNPWGGSGYDPVPGADPEHDEELRRSAGQRGGPGLPGPHPSGRRDAHDRVQDCTHDHRHDRAGHGHGHGHGGGNAH